MLFSAELPAFRRHLPEDMQESIEAFAREEREEAKTKREAARARKRAREEAAEEKSRVTADETDQGAGKALAEDAAPSAKRPPEHE